jgi:predicted NBD/HSP70 family sugar kinase
LDFYRLQFGEIDIFTIDINKIGISASMHVIASTDQVRRQNSLLVMQSLRRGEALSHTGIAAQTGLASATVSVITNELLTAGFVEKLEQSEAKGRGRPRVLFRPRIERGFIVIIILSSDSASFSLLDFGGKLLDQFSLPRTDKISRAAVLELISGGLERLMGRAKITSEQLLHIGLSSKGVMDPVSGALLWSPVTLETPVDFADHLSKSFSASIAVYNETALVAQALWQKHALINDPPMNSLVTLSLSHNIGLGIARLGSDNRTEPEIIAPNFGHMLHAPDGALCRCGARGCIEAYSGFYAILRSAFEVPISTVPANFVPLGEVDKIASLARAQDRRAAFAFRQAGLAIGNGLARLFSLYGVMDVFVGGQGMRFFDLLESGLQDGLRQSSLMRFAALPKVHVVSNEQALLAEGHKSLALKNCDAQILSPIST